MNEILQVEDLALSDIAATKYAAAFFASGYESRCISLSQRIDPGLVKRAVVWGFEKEALPALRRAHDLHYRQKWNIQPVIMGNADFAAAWCSSKELLHGHRTIGPLHILVDYSSMSRIWYAALINFVRFSALNREIVVDFAYTSGKYSRSYPDELQNSVVAQVVAIPGLEGLSGTRESSIAVLGLGFAPAAAVGVLERIQPSMIFSFLASPGARNEYTDICHSANEKLTQISKFLLPLPLQSVSTTYRRLCEAVVPYLADQQITFIPMGPKPHVLASMLVSSRFRQVGCIYAQLARRDVSDIEENSEPFITRVTLTASDG